MKKIILIGIIIILIMINFTSLTFISKQCNIEKMGIDIESISERAVSQEFIIRFKKDIDSETKYNLIQNNGGIILGENKILDAVTVRVEGNTEVFLSIKSIVNIQLILSSLIIMHNCNANQMIKSGKINGGLNQCYVLLLGT